MQKGKYTVGDRVWVYDYAWDEFTLITIDSVKVLNDEIYYNGRFIEEELSSDLEVTYNYICDYNTAQYRKEITKITEKYMRLKEKCKKNIQKKL